MTNEEILTHADCTVLRQDATWEAVKQACDDGLKYHPAQVCVPPAYVRRAKDYVGDRLKIGGAVGYPNGYNTTAVKVYEARDAILCGADEIDMVINIGWAKEHNYKSVTEEIHEIKQACGDKILKVIIETYLLDDEEKIRLCDCVVNGTADYIKTSTGFVKGGATPSDVCLLLNHLAGTPVRVKASGGIATFEDAERYLNMGVQRIGTSKLLGLMKRAKENKQ